ncbi:MAG: response regulator [Oscillospiraceae bacterium]|jgi:putative two-component system response regulator|nr:response regulator [Oscillospiraceae bacterium]
MEKEIVILVDDDIANLKIGRNALISNYEVYTVPSAAKLFELLAQIIPSIILLDINMPETDGYETIKILKAQPETAEIPVIFLTGKSDVESELEGLKLGAIDYISKPFATDLLNKRVELHLSLERQQRLLKAKDAELRGFNENLQQMVEIKTRNIFNLQISILRTIADLVERRDGDTGGHILRTQGYLRILLDAMTRLNLYPEQMKEYKDSEFIIISSQLHDVGKIAIDDSILRKPGSLTVQEFNEIKKHPIFGGEIIDTMMGNIPSDNDFLLYAKIFAETHHEKWDGSGYPTGAKNEEIPLLGRVMAVADVYDALVSKRPYKKPFSHEDAVKIISSGSGTHFDPLIAHVFEQVSNEFRSIYEEKAAS